MHFDYDVYEKIHVDFFYNHCKVNNFFLHVLNHVLKKFVINFTINCFNEVNNKCNMKFIHKNNLFSFDLYGVRKIAPRSWSGFGLRLALELGLGGGQFSSWAIFLKPIYIVLQLFWQDTKHSLKLTLLSILLFVVFFSKIIYEEMLRPGYTVKYFFQSISWNTYFTKTAEKYSWYTFWSTSWNTKIDFQNFLYRERLSYWICFYA